MADRDAVLLPPARQFYESRPIAERLRIDRVIADICDSPEPDNVLRLLVDAPPDFPFYYRDDEYVIVYDELNAWTIAIWDISYNTPDLILDLRRRA